MRIGRILSFLSLAFFPAVHAQNPTITSIIQEVNIDSLMYRVEEISGFRGVTVNGVTDTIFSRHRLQPGNELAYRFIMQKFASYGLMTDSVLFGSLGKNALAIQPGLVYPNRYYMITGHYDAMPGGTFAPAADDDGSGTGAVLEAARVLSQYQFEYTIVYAIFDEEEQGLAGSSNYANTAFANHDTLLGVLNMDAIAWDGDNDSVARVHTKPIGNSEIISDTVVGVNTNYHIGIDLQVNNPGATYSDHASFWNKGYSAVLIIEDWDNDPNPHYHTVSDSVNYFNVPFFHKMARLSIASTAALAIPYTGQQAGGEELPSTTLQLYPNPVSRWISIGLDHIYPEVTVTLTDLNGRTVLRGDYQQQKWISLNAEGLAPGLYLVTVTNGQQHWTRKIIKTDGE